MFCKRGRRPHAARTSATSVRSESTNSCAYISSGWVPSFWPSMIAEWRRILSPMTRNSHTSRRRQNYLIFAGLFVTLLLFLSYRWVTNQGATQNYRLSDQTDIFETFAGRETCGFGALDIHRPFEPLCSNATSVLRAMSDGGRGGFDMPYQPRGCDLRFYTTSEICRILNKFESVLIYGDSLMRHLTSAFAMLLRENLDWGGQEQWKAPA